jgi:hypothetical protein
MSKIAGIMQPTYLPWLGYFDLIDQSDVFILLDDVQFVQKSWQQRNRIKTAQGALWLSVPVLSSGKRFQLIRNTEIDLTQTWQEKHFKSIALSYAKAGYAKDYLPGIKAIYERPWKSLCDLNEALLFFLMEAFGIRTPVIRASSLTTRSDKNEHIIDICRQVNADILYDAGGAVEAIDAGLIQTNWIRVVFQEYEHPCYRQMHGNFISHLSAIDLLLNEGPGSMAIIKSGVKKSCVAGGL